MRAIPVVFAAAILAAIVGMSANASDTVVRCGQLSDITPASFVISSPNSDPLRVVIPEGKGIGEASGYTCVSVLPGRPAAQLAGLLSPDMPGYVAQP
ncbi:MAG TPA: hypothetical protein VGR85_01875 [Candidatus Limnocylindria bacterium]|jgi:hypothetical protein|nr:hypothetical protein [Candidatus Limnocylindria bacterium]